MNAPTTIPDETFHRLVDDLMHARDEFRIIELIGEVANVWPESAPPYAEAEHPDHQTAATREMPDRVFESATAPDDFAPKANAAPGTMPLAWPPARPRPLNRGIINPPWRTPE